MKLQRYYHLKYCSIHSFNFRKLAGFDTNESIPLAKHSSALSGKAFAVICIHTRQ